MINFMIICIEIKYVIFNKTWKQVRGIFSCQTSAFCGAGWSFWVKNDTFFMQNISFWGAGWSFWEKKVHFLGIFFENVGKLKFWLKVPSLARSVPKPLKVPSLARSVQKPLKVPSLARSVQKPLKMGQSQTCERAGGEGEWSRCTQSGGVPASFALRCRPPTPLVAYGCLWCRWVGGSLKYKSLRLLTVDMGRSEISNCLLMLLRWWRVVSLLWLWPKTRTFSTSSILGGI